MVIYQANEARCPAFLRTRRDARIVRLEYEALWIAPGAEEPVVIIGREDWARVHANCPGLAPFGALPRARRRDLLAAWLADAPASARVADGAALVALVREKLVAADRMDAPAAVAAVASLVAWVEQAPEGFVTGRIIPCGGADIRTLYLDTRPTADWPALARIGEAWAFAFAPGFAIEARMLSEEELDAWAAERAMHGPAPRNERQLTFSFFAGSLCAAK